MKLPSVASGESPADKSDRRDRDSDRFGVFIVSKFTHGAWLVVVTIPILVLIVPYNSSTLRFGCPTTFNGGDLDEPLKPINHTVIVPVSGIHRGVINALQYARSISSNNVRRSMSIDEDATAKLKERWEKRSLGVPLVVLPSPYRELERGR